MLSLDKREKFIKRLSTTQLKEKVNISITQSSIKVDKNLKFEVLFDELQKKYSMNQKSARDGAYLKMEVKKQYY